ncbi:MAG: hypothetical protein ACOYOA_14115 [Saprospiraceae bacterium]
MNKIIIFLIISSFTALNAQVKYQKGSVIKNPNVALSSATEWIEVYNGQNFHGAKQKLYASNSAITVPFETDRGSIKVAPGYIAYITLCDEFNEVVVLSGDYFVFSLGKICALKFAKKAVVTVTYNGISTNIHNNDCKKHFGSVKVRVTENRADGSVVNTAIDPSSSMRASSTFAVKAYDVSSLNYIGPQNNFIYNNTPVPSIPVGANKFFAFAVNKEALDAGKISVVVETDLASAHKTCDLCDDYSNNVRMARSETSSTLIQNIPLFAGAGSPSRELIVGPYRATGSRAGSAITASAGSSHDIRVHFKVQ